jgi:hypothetical protein
VGNREITRFGADSGCNSAFPLDTNAFSKDATRSDPSVYSTAIVADLEPFAVDRLHNVQIFNTMHLAEHNVSDRESGTIDWYHRAEVARFDTSFHRCAPGSK